MPISFKGSKHDVTKPFYNKRFSQSTKQVNFFFNIKEHEKFLAMVSDPTSQVTFKKEAYSVCVRGAVPPKLKSELPHGPAIPLLGIQPKK